MLSQKQREIHEGYSHIIYIPSNILCWNLSIDSPKHVPMDGVKYFSGGKGMIFVLVQLRILPVDTENLIPLSLATYLCGGER